MWSVGCLDLNLAVILGHIASLLVRFELANKGLTPYGWAPRILIQCGVPYPEVWDILHEMYESQVCNARRIIDLFREFTLHCYRFHPSTIKEMFKQSLRTSQCC